MDKAKDVMTEAATASGSRTRLNLAARLILGSLLIAVVPLVTLIAIAYHHTKQQIVADVVRNLHGVADSRANYIETYARARRRDIADLARTPDIVRSIAKFENALDAGTHDGYQRVDDELRPFLSFFKETSQYDDLYILTPAGKILFSVNQDLETGTNILDITGPRSALAKTIDRASTAMETEVSDFEIYPPTGHYAAFIAAPVFEAGRITAVVVIRMSNTELYEMVNDYTGLGATGEALLASRVGNEAVIISPMRHADNPAITKTFPLDTNTWLPIVQAVHGGTGNGMSMDDRGREVLAEWRYLPSLRWGMVVKMDKEEAFGTITEIKTAGIAMTLFVVTGVVVIALVLVRSIANPISALARGTERFRHRDFSVRVGENGPQDIADLSRAFNVMAAELEKNHILLNQQVDEPVQPNADLAQEISEREIVEHALRSSERRLQRVTDAIPGAVYRYKLSGGTEQSFIFISRGCEALFGHTPEEILADFSLTWNLVLEADAARLRDSISISAARQEAWKQEFRIRRPDGELRWIRGSSIPEAPTVSGDMIWNGIFVDITLEKNAQAELDRFFDVSIDLLCIAGLDGYFKRVNRAFIETLGYSEVDLLSRPFTDFVHPDDRASTVKKMEELIAGMDVTCFENRYRCSDGSWKWLEWNCGAPPADSDLLFAAARDITSQKRMQEDILRRQKLESIALLAGGLAHDLNNLLTVIVGNISVMISRTSAEDAGYIRLRNIEEAAERTMQLTHRLLTFSKGGAPIRKTASISQLLRDTISFTLSGSNCGYNLDIPPVVQPVSVDTAQISQVVQNLMINADQAMPDGGVINVCVDDVEVDGTNGLPLDKGRYVRIAVTDKGTGIAPEHRNKIFDPYFTTKQKGSGLGLATCYAIVHNHSGCITLDSEIGAGSTFHVYLPVSDDDIGLAQASDRAAPRPARHGRILVMDDEDMIRAVATDMLTHLGYEVCVAADGKAAVAMYKHDYNAGSAFDAVILDLTVPGAMGGREALAMLLKMYPEVIAFVSSGYSDDPVMAHYANYGFRGVIRKPYKLQELDDELTAVLGA